jgi:hypothetical protein
VPVSIQRIPFSRNRPAGIGACRAGQGTRHWLQSFIDRVKVSPEQRARLATRLRLAILYRVRRADRTHGGIKRPLGNVV